MACPQDSSWSEPFPTTATTSLPRKLQCGLPLGLPTACTYHNYSSAEPAKVAPVQLYPTLPMTLAGSSYSHCWPTTAVAATLHSPLQLRLACLGSPGEVSLRPMPTSAPAGLPKASSTQSTKGKPLHKATPSRPGKAAILLIHQNKHRETAKMGKHRNVF